MKRWFLLILTGLLFSSILLGQDVQLWPEIQPFKTGRLKVSDLHELYYELCGNPDGKPVFVLHGGPGGSCSPYMRRFFNPETFLIVLHDQRGAGRSTPFAEIRENTTRHLIADIEQLRKKLDLDQIILFGGSWGSTLALAYGETYPERVSGMILRGIFTATRQEIDHFYHGGVKLFFPGVYNEFIIKTGNTSGKDMPAYLLEKIQQGDSLEKQRYSRIWAEYELLISSLELPVQELERIMQDFNPLAFGLLENYYMAHQCFLREGELLEGAHKLDMPIFLVNGRYDMICPPVNAWRLHERLPNSKLIIAEQSGHWMGEDNIELELLKASQTFE